MKIDGDENVQVNGDYISIAQLVNIYFDNKMFWYSFSNEQLRQIIQKCKQNNRKMLKDKLYRPTTLVAFTLMIIMLAILLLAFIYSINIMVVNAILVGVMALMAICLFIEEKPARREYIFRQRNHNTIEICEQILFERKYD